MPSICGSVVWFDELLPDKNATGLHLTPVLAFSIYQLLSRHKRSSTSDTAYLPSHRGIDRMTPLLQANSHEGSRGYSTELQPS